MNNQARDYDVAIIGGGIIGASIARELSRLSLKAVLLEAREDLARGASGANSGIIHAGYDPHPFRRSGRRAALALGGGG